MGLKMILTQYVNTRHICYTLGFKSPLAWDYFQYSIVCVDEFEYYQQAQAFS